jgi:hypothetical protein
VAAAHGLDLELEHRGLPEVDGCTKHPPCHRGKVKRTPP